MWQFGRFSKIQSHIYKIPKLVNLSIYLSQISNSYIIRIVKYLKLLSLALYIDPRCLCLAQFTWQCFYIKRVLNYGFYLCNYCIARILWKLKFSRINKFLFNSCYSNLFSIFELSFQVYTSHILPRVYQIRPMSYSQQ